MVVRLPFEPLLLDLSIELSADMPVGETVPAVDTVRLSTVGLRLPALLARNLR